MISFGNIYDLAGLAVTKFGLRGIDWSALAAKGRSSVWDRDYIADYMSPAFARMIAVSTFLDLDPSQTPEEMKQAYDTTATALNEAAGSIVRLIGLPILEGQVSLDASREAVRKTVSMLVQSSSYAYALHLNETIHHSNYSDTEIAAHASLCCGIMNAIIALDALKFFQAIGITKQASGSQSGLGIAPALLIAGVAVICILAYAVVQCVSMNKVNQQIAHMCDSAQASGDQATTQQCVSALVNSNKAAGTVPVTLIKQILDTVMPYALAGAAIYVGLLFAPGIVKNIMARPSRSAA